MTDDQVHSAMVRWLAALTGVTVIRTHQSGPAPAEPYIAVNLTTTRQIRQHAQVVDYDTEDSAGAVAASTVLEVEWQFSCHAYGEEPLAILRPVRSAIQLAQMHEPLLPDLVIHECSQIRNVPDWLNERWEPRAQIDIFVRGLTRDGFDVDVIEQAHFDLERD